MFGKTESPGAEKNMGIALFEHLRLISKAGEEVAYVVLPKIAHTSLVRTFFDSETERAQVDKAAHDRFPEFKGKMSNSKEILFANFIFYAHSLLPSGRAKADPRTIFDFTGLQGLFYDAEQKTWMQGGWKQETGYQCSPLTAAEINRRFIFTFVRNPFSRLVSTFQNKFLYDRKKKTFVGIKGLSYEVAHFTDFIINIAQMKEEEEEMDWHIKPQTFFLDEVQRHGIEVQFVGKLENMQAEFEPLRQKYNLLPLEKLNSSKAQANVHHNNWRDYYTPEVATIAYLRYKEDFLRLGYAESYSELMDYLETRPASFVRKQLKRRWLGKLGLPAYKKYLAR